MILPFFVNAKKNKGIQAEFKYCQFSVVMKKKKLILNCKPISSRAKNSDDWIRECNGVAYNLLNNEYYQSILVDKEIEDDPFGRTSYGSAKSEGSFMLKKSIRKTFKIISE